MRNKLLLWAALLLIAAPAFGADTNHYPSTLVDQTCTDSYDSPAGATPPVATIGPFGYFTRPAAQTAGDPDSLCDNDPYIKTGALAADTYFGPFRLPDNARGFYLFVDADTVTGGDTTWRIGLYGEKPHDGAKKTILLEAPVETGTGDVYYQFGIGPDSTYGSSADNEMDAAIPSPFYILLDFIGSGATSITAEISLVPLY